MAKYDGLARALRRVSDPSEDDDDTHMAAAYVIEHLQDVVRRYNPEDPIFNDEKKQGKEAS